MARILILQEADGFNPLLRSIEGQHEIYCVHTMADALSVLQVVEIALIITTVYDVPDLFAFLVTVKGDHSLRAIPILCFSRERTTCATKLDPTSEHAALLCGASKYLSMDSFCRAPAYTTCEACPIRGEQCDYAGLRHEVEDMLVDSKLKSCVGMASIHPSVDQLLPVTPKLRFG